MSNNTKLGIIQIINRETLINETFFRFCPKTETFLGAWCLHLNEKESPFYLEKVNYFSYSKQAKCLEYLSKCQMSKIRLEKYAEDKICTTQLLLINSHLQLKRKRSWNKIEYQNKKWLFSMTCDFRDAS